jgi:hypothetical protein
MPGQSEFKIRYLRTTGAFSLDVSLVVHYGRLHGVVTVEATSLISACVGIEDNALDKGVSFVEGHELDAERAAWIPPGYVGMMLPH